MLQAMGRLKVETGSLACLGCGYEHDCGTRGCAILRAAAEAFTTLAPTNEPLTQSDLDNMDYDKVWIDYGDDGEWALVVSGRIYSLANLEGCGFEDILQDEVAGETMERPSGDYTVYRRAPNREGP